MAETLLQAYFQRVVRRVRYAGDLTRGGENTTAWRIIERTSRIKPPLVGVARIRDWLAVHISRHEHCRVSFDEARQMCSLGTHVCHLEQEILFDRAVKCQIPIL